MLYAFAQHFINTERRMLYTFNQQSINRIVAFMMEMMNVFIIPRKWWIYLSFHGNDEYIVDTQSEWKVL